MSQSKLSELINDETIPEEDSAPGDFVAAVRDVEGTPEDVAIDLGQELADKAPLSATESNANGRWWKLYTSANSGLLLQITSPVNLGATDQDTGGIVRTDPGVDVDFPILFDTILWSDVYVDRDSSGNTAVWGNSPDLTTSQAQNVRAMRSVESLDDVFAIVIAFGTFDDS